MFASDFLFDDQKASDFGLIISSESGGDAVVSGGEIDIVSVRPPDRDSFDYYIGKLDSPIQFNFSVLKYSCDDPNDIYVTPEEESKIARWLLRKSKHQGYGWLQFDQDYYRDICYKVFFTEMKPMQVNGRTVGFELACISNCGYAFTNLKKHIFTLNNSENVSIILTNDMLTYTYPHITIKNGSGNFYFGNVSDREQGYSYFENISSTLTIDSENDIIDGISSPSDFNNWIFPRLVDGENILTTNSSNALLVELNYREVRRILV